MTNTLEFCKISVLARDSFKPPFFIGSSVRGALGHALKSIVCIKDTAQCNGCEFAKSCVFFDFYQCKNVYHNFRFDFELGMPRYDFGIFLFGKEVENAPVILAALHKMLCEIGLKSSDKTLRFKEIFIFVNDEFCFGGKDSGNIKMPLEFGERFDTNDFATRVKIKLITPLRIKKNNVFVRDSSLEVGDIFRSIYQRKLAILGKERDKCPPFSGTITAKNLRYIELYRKSCAQKTAMNLGGLIGEIVIDDLDKDSYELLKIGELVGIGKQCSFGLGKITICED